MTFDLIIVWRFSRSNYQSSSALKQACGWRVMDAIAKISLFDLIWPLTYLCNLWPQSIMEANIGHLPTKFGYKHAYGWKVINPNSLAGKLLHLTSFDLWPTYVTFDPKLSWRTSHLPTKFGYKQAYGWKVINPNNYIIAGKLTHLTFEVTWPLTSL